MSSTDLKTIKLNQIGKIVDASIQKAQIKVQVPQNDPQVLNFCKEFRKVSIGTLGFYNDKIYKAALKSESQAFKVVNMAVYEIYSKMIKLLHSSSSIFKRAGYFEIIWMLLKQMVYLMIISISAMILVNIPKSRIRRWYCQDHPCENDQDDLINATSGDDLDDLNFDNLKGSDDHFNLDNDQDSDFDNL